MSFFLDRYATLMGNLPGDSALRAAAASAFKSAGLPGEQRRRIEAWKYTSLRAVAERQFGTGPRHEAETILRGVKLLDAPRAVFVDGIFRTDLSTHQPARFADSPDFGTLTWPDREPMVALNTMLTQDGAAIRIAAGVDAGTLQLVSIGASDGDSHARHIIRLEEGASLTVLETFAGDGTYLLNNVVEAHIAPGAKLTHIRIQQESATAFHVTTTYADVEAGGVYDSFGLTLGGRVSRDELHVNLTGPGALAHMNGANILAGSQHADFTSVVRHQSPGCTSRQTVKNVLADKSRGVFQGRIEVARDAQKTDGYQMNQALLLSPDAEVDCKPELEIFADDVKCSHGATVGELDAEQMFYLRSRGVPEAQAKTILVRAFLAELLETVGDATIRAHLDGLIENWWERQAA